MRLILNINKRIILRGIDCQLGGVKKKSIGQSEKRQKMEPVKKDKHSKQSTTQMQTKIKNMMVPKLDDAEAEKIFGSMKAITIYSTAKNLGVNASIAWNLIRNLEAEGILTKIGGYSGHYVYKYTGIQR